MNNTFSLEKISRTGYFDIDSLLRQHKLDLMAEFMYIKSTNPRLRQDEVARQLG